MQQTITDLVHDVAALLQRTERKVVFAESCTGGLVAASLARVPGISQYLCGSAVVYRLDTKARWLDIPESLLHDPGPVSGEVAALMAEAVLTRTPEADFAVSVTGHLGPDAPVLLDGTLFVAIASRHEEHFNPLKKSVTADRQAMPANRYREIGKSMVCEYRLPAEPSDRILHPEGNLESQKTYPAMSFRERRQQAAVEFVLNCLMDVLL